MSYKSLDMRGDNLNEAQNMLKTATVELQKSNVDIESVKKSLLNAQKSLYKDSGETSQKLAKKIEGALNSLSTFLNSTSVSQRQVLNDAVIDIKKVNKSIDSAKETRSSVDINTTSIISSLAGKLSLATNGLNFSGQYQTAGTQQNSSLTARGINKNTLFASSGGVPSGLSDRLDSPQLTMTVQEAVASIVKFGKWRTDDKSFGGVKIDTSYGGETGSADRRKFATTMYNGLDTTTFTSAGFFSQSGETGMMASKIYNENGGAQPTVVFHVDDVTYNDYNPINIDNNLIQPTIAIPSDKRGEKYKAAKKFVNGVVSMQKDQALFVSTKGNGGPTYSGACVKPIFDILADTEEGDYEKYGFQTKEGVEVTNIFQDDSRSQVPKVYNTDYYNSFSTYVTQYSDGTEYTFDYFALDENHDTIRTGEGGLKVEQMITTWLQFEGTKYNSGLMGVPKIN